VELGFSAAVVRVRWAAATAPWAHSSTQSARLRRPAPCRPPMYEPEEYLVLAQALGGLSNLQV
jgi:hypothetical protein